MFGRLWNALVAAAYNAVNNSLYRPFFSVIDLLMRWGLLTAPVWYVDVISTSNIAGTYANGTSGVGATLTKASAGAFPSTDGITTPVLNMYVLLTGQSTALQNGLYTLTRVGSSSVAWQLTRFAGWDQSAEMIAGSAFYVNNPVTGVGTNPQTSNHAGQVWAYTGTTGPTVGVTSLTFAADSLLRAAIPATVTAAQTFADGTLKVQNPAATHTTTVDAGATVADFVATLPAATCTLAQSGAQTGAPSATAAPTFGGTAPPVALTQALSGFTGTTTGRVTTITAGAATVAAHALAGGTVTDGTIETTIVDNSALTATTGTITTVTALSATITATGSAWASPIPVGTISAVPTAAHTHAQT